MLLLLCLVTYLRGLYDRLVAPLLIYLGCNDPAHGTFCGSLGNLTAKHKPAIIVVHASVVELQVAGKRLYSQFLTGIIGARGELAAFCIGRSDDVVGP